MLADIDNNYSAAPPMTFPGTDLEWGMAHVNSSNASASPMSEQDGKSWGDEDATHLKMIGIYGMPGLGKTDLMQSLKRDVDSAQTDFYDNATLLSMMVQDGLDPSMLQESPNLDKHRQQIISWIKNDATREGRPAIIEGQLERWSDRDTVSRARYLEAELANFTHIVYIDNELDIKDVGDDLGARGRKESPHDQKSSRSQDDFSEIQAFCINNRILHTRVPFGQEQLNRLVALITSFQVDDVKINTEKAVACIDMTWKPSETHKETFLVFDGDNTLTLGDTYPLTSSKPCRMNALKTAVFFKPPSEDHPVAEYLNLRQRTLLCEAIMDATKYGDCTGDFASRVTIHPDILMLLKHASSKTHIGLVVLTQQFRLMWQKILERYNLTNNIVLLGGSRLDDGYVVTEELKREVVRHLQRVHHATVWAFGGKIQDYKMLMQANEAVVVADADDKGEGSTSKRLVHDMQKGGRCPFQVDLVPRHSTEDEDEDEVVRPNLLGLTLHNKVLASRQYGGLRVHLGMDDTAGNSQTAAMLDTQTTRPRLRKIHHTIGKHLAVAYFPKIFGTETFETTKHSYLGGERTLVVALMRSGEPLAYGVNKILQHAAFNHAFYPDDIERSDLQSLETVVLVDAVINTGETMANYVQHIRSLHTKIRIIIVAAEITYEAVQESSVLPRAVRKDDVDLIALRKVFASECQDAKMKADIGDRLFGISYAAERQDLKSAKVEQQQCEVEGKEKEKDGGMERRDSGISMRMDGSWLSGKAGEECQERFKNVQTFFG